MEVFFGGDVWWALIGSGDDERWALIGSGGEESQPSNSASKLEIKYPQNDAALDDKFSSLF